MLDLKDIQDYLYCSLWFYLKHRSKVGSLIDTAGQVQTLPSYTTLELPGLAVSQALGAYLTGKYSLMFPELVKRVWEIWFSQKGVGDDVAKALAGYAQVRSAILNQFLGGKILNKDRQPYREPRMTIRYKNMLASSGLAHLAETTDPPGLSKLGCATAELAGLGTYYLADAYADSFLMAARYSPPIPAAVYGMRVKTRIPLPGGLAVTAVADLVIPGASATTIEVHDYSPAFYFDPGWVGRRLDVVAAMYMQSADAEKPFPPVERVVYRHFLSGKTIERRRVRQSRLVFALDAARRGIQAGIFTPQFLSGDLTRCRACPAQAVCIPPGGDLAEWFLPGEVGIAKRVRGIVNRLEPVDTAMVNKLSAALEDELLPLDVLAALDTYERTRNDEKREA